MIYTTYIQSMQAYEIIHSSCNIIPFIFNLYWGIGILHIILQLYFGLTAEYRTFRLHIVSTENCANTESHVNDVVYYQSHTLIILSSRIRRSLSFTALGL